MSVIEYLWDDVNDCVLEECDDAGATQVVYTHELGPFGPLLSEHRGGAESFHHFDALGSTAILTDTTGFVTDTFAYDAWGDPIARTGTTPTPYTWVGRWGYQDDTASTGGYYVRARTLSTPRAGWISRDPAFPDAGIQVYEYADNSPTGRTDPTGLFCNTPCTGLSHKEICDPVFLKKYQIQTNGGGGVVCCEGKAYACLWPAPGFPDPGKCEHLDYCGKVHEEGHVKHTKCDNTQAPYRAQFPEHLKGDKVECQLRASDISCLIGKLSRGETNSTACEAAMRKLVDTQADYVLSTKPDGSFFCPKSAVDKANKALAKYRR